MQLSASAGFLGRWCGVLLVLLSVDVAAAPQLGYHIVQEAPHDPMLFTQGLVLDGEDVIESSGQYGRSFVRRYPLANPDQFQERRLPAQHFAEGVALVNQHLYLLTWREQTLYVLDKMSLQPLFKLAYKGEGWGLTFDGTHLIMSDGSSTLYYRDKKNFAIKRELHVQDNNQPVSLLNELEYAWGTIWANVWREDKIMQIDPLSGKVMAEVNLSVLVKENGENFNKVLNGIAYDKNEDAFWVTGKYWPKKYLIKIDSGKN